MEIYLTIFFRTITTMLILLFFTVFLMGKKSIGELPVLDTLTIIVLGNVVGAVIIDSRIENLPAIFAIVILALFEKMVTKISLRFNRLRRKISFEPTIVIKEGRIIYRNLKKIGYALDNILMLLRQKDIFDISQVEYAIIEANGKISILKKPEFKTVTVKDLNLPLSPVKPPVTVIVEGEFQQDNIHILKTSEQKIKEKLAAQGYHNHQEIFYASMDHAGNLNVSPYEN